MPFSSITRQVQWKAILVVFLQFCFPKYMSAHHSTCVSSHKGSSGTKIGRGMNEKLQKQHAAASTRGQKHRDVLSKVGGRKEYVRFGNISNRPTQILLDKWRCELKTCTAANTADFILYVASLLDIPSTVHNLRTSHPVHPVHRSSAPLSAHHSSSPESLHAGIYLLNQKCFTVCLE